MMKDLGSMRTGRSVQGKDTEKSIAAFRIRVQLHTSTLPESYTYLRVVQA